MATLASPPREREWGSWFQFILLVGAALCLSLVVSTTAWLPEAGRLSFVVIWASIVGVLLARSPLPNWLAWTLGILLGVEYGILYAGKLLPGLDVIAGDISVLATQGWTLVNGEELSAELAAQTPFARSLAVMLGRTTIMLNNLSAWLESMRSGVENRDNTVLWFGTAVLAWMLAWNAGYQLFRRHNTFGAFLPLGLGVVANVAFTEVGIEYVYVFLGITLVTLVWANASRLQSLWARRGLDYSPELKRDSVMVGTVLAAAILVIAIAMPYITYSRAAWFFWDTVGPSLESLYDRLDQAFAGRNRISRPRNNAGGLASHDLGSGSRPTSRPVFSVTTSDPPPPPPETIIRGYGALDAELFVPKHYWRQRTYDVYTGRGWETSRQDQQSLAAGEPLTSGDYPGALLTQTYALEEPAELAFGVNEPVYIDRDYRAFLRGVDDVAALTVPDQQYTVVSLVPSAGVNELRAAEDAYPDWVSERHLRLPRLPDRIAETTAAIILEAGATTRYDKARAIEAYLREYEYDLDVPPPPAGADFVDHFLFTSKRGFCDYSASAMVVMLRTQGIAARYASGFGMGTYDYTQRAWVVREENSHAWAEVYFPGYGWIEFEPTPTERVFNRGSGGGGAAPPSIPEPEIPAEVYAPQIPTIFKWAAGVFAALLFVLVWPPRWFRRRGRTPRAQVYEVYAQLVRRARWLGLGPVDGMTASEYLAALADALEARSHLAEGSAELIDVIDRVYQRARYSDDTMTFLESHQAENAWLRLKKVMTRLFFAPKRRRTLPVAEET
ncbi:MAG: transglutaminase-like domain-containing protein [Anaerolineae bacterium]